MTPVLQTGYNFWKLLSLRTVGGILGVAILATFVVGTLVESPGASSGEGAATVVTLFGVIAIGVFLRTRERRWSCPGCGSRTHRDALACERCDVVFDRSTVHTQASDTASRAARTNTFETEASVYKAFTTSAEGVRLPDRTRVEKRLREASDDILRHLDDDEAILHVIPFDLGTKTPNFAVLTTKRVFETETWSRSMLRNDVVGVREWEIDAIGLTFHYVFILNQVAKENLWAYDISEKQQRRQPELKEAHDRCRANILQLKLNDFQDAVEHYSYLVAKWYKGYGAER